MPNFESFPRKANEQRCRRKNQILKSADLDANDRTEKGPITLAERSTWPRLGERQLGVKHVSIAVKPNLNTNPNESFHNSGVFNSAPTATIQLSIGLVISHLIKAKALQNRTQNIFPRLSSPIDCRTADTGRIS
ncbi:hypothetical protein BC938DRAFT_471522 [Jimgerdemannia flammicorona]|uniref:Uncharacterized protein n=1 Tax=Jimgerdemannia flammicorona TaxID=994334 RepID=A0A433Q7Z4_9FUNG|nr:hypothetical protein BC938DRAFT_471522 [Jimgerdemannia flammicorona]